MAKTILDRCYDRVCGLFGSRRETEAETQLDRDIDQLINQIDPLVREILIKYPLRNLKDDLGHLRVLLDDFGGISTEVSKLLSILITEAEKFFGDSTGAQKKEFVISAFIRLYRRYNIDLPKIPEFLEEPFLRWFLEIAIDYTIDLFNRNFGDDWINRARLAPTVETNRLLTS
jgi:hypothetical protein